MVVSYSPRCDLLSDCLWWAVTVQTAIDFLNCDNTPYVCSFNCLKRLLLDSARLKCFVMHVKVSVSLLSCKQLLVHPSLKMPVLLIATSLEFISCIFHFSVDTQLQHYKAGDRECHRLVKVLLRPKLPKETEEAKTV